MALICEMEGNLEAATDWLERSNSTYEFENQMHKDNCAQYMALLVYRKAEDKIIDKQVRSYANKP